jgi:hypothetical protein
MVFPILGGNSAVGGYSIDNSLRFNDGDNPYLSRTPASAGNRKTWTWSGWVKRSAIADGGVFGIGTSGSYYFNIRYQTDYISVVSETPSNVLTLRTNALYRDSSAWYNIVFVLDTTQGTDSNRAKLYINGEQVTSFFSTTYPSLNADLIVNSVTPHYIGALGNNNTINFDGYMAEVNFIDGQALSPTDFGEFDEDSGIWKPKEYEGTYGTNGFYLDFENSGSLGSDQSGNGNNFTPTNLASTDQVLDSPTNNFATLNALHRYTDRLSEGNLKLNGVEKTGTPVELQTSTLGATSGKWYWEVKFEWTGSLTSTSVRMGIGTELSVPPNPNSSSDEGSAVQIQANKGSTLSFRNLNSSPTTNTTGFNTLDPNDIFMFALDIDNKKLFIGKNGSWYNSADPVAGTNAQAYSWTFSNGDITFPVISFYSGDTASNTYNHSLLPNFGNPAFSISSGNSDGNGYGNFEYAPPSGYLALCTQNLATESSPTIDDGSQYFNTVLWTGNDSNPRTITGVGFQSDFVWTKCRTNASHNKLYDSNRGLNIANTLNSSGSDAEYSSTNGGVSGSDSDGFIVNAGSSNDSAINDSAFTYVAWNWKANGGTTSSNTSGSITSTVQANPTAGFSIVTYTGNSIAGATVGHGLGKVPAMFIIKNRGQSNNWPVYHQANTSAPETELIKLDETFATSDSVLPFNDTAPTSTVFSVSSWDGVNSSSYDYVAYCFAEIEGYSKFGSYTGNGSTDGTFVYTGFRPAFLMIKRSDGVTNWATWDSKRDTYNEMFHMLQPNVAGLEITDANPHIDYTSNGFKFRTSWAGQNASGGTYIYMAFAESPFVTSSGVPVVAR